MGITAASVLAAFFGYLLSEQLRLTVSSYYIPLDSVGAAFDGFKIIQISDLHHKSFGKNNSRLLRLMQERCPDIIVITGDLVDERHEGVDYGLDFIEKAAHIAPVFYVTGNHEKALPQSELEYFLAEAVHAGAAVLEDRTALIERFGEKLYISGMSDRASPEADELKELLSVTKDGISVLLAHRPHYTDAYSESGADLVISGHAHGGLVRLPFIGGLIAPGQGLFPRLTSGVHYHDGFVQVISRGLGNSVLPIRFNNTPEVVEIVLRSGSQELDCNF